MSETTQELPVGPELDAAVARVLGWTWVDGLPAPMFSQTWGDAGKVAEELRRRGWEVEIKTIPAPYGDYKATIWLGSTGWDAFAPTMPEAVCRVVLLAAEVLREGGE